MFRNIVTKYSFVIPIAEYNYRIVTNNYTVWRSFIREVYTTDNYLNITGELNVDTIINALHIDIKQSLELKNKTILGIRYLSYVLSAYLENCLLSHNIFFLHGSSFVHKGQAYVFIGRSGMGKTTMVKKCKKKMRLSDDTTIIKKERNSFFVYFSPFDKRLINCLPMKKVRLSAILVIAKANASSIHRMHCKTKLTSLFDNSYYFMNLDNLVKSSVPLNNKGHLIKMFLQLMKTIPINKFICSKNVGYSEFIGI